MLLAAGPPRDISCTLHSSAESAQLAGIRGTASVLSAVWLARYCSAATGATTHFYACHGEDFVHHNLANVQPHVGKMVDVQMMIFPVSNLKQVSSVAAMVAVRR